MMKTMYSVTEQEYEVMKKRTEEAVKAMEDGETVLAGLCGYAEANGYSTEEALELVEKEIIPTVDTYNRECRDHIEDESNERILNKISDRVEGMALADECKYKLGVLVALRSAGKEILGHVAVNSPEQIEASYEELTDEEMMKLEDGQYTDEMLDQINEQLLYAIENCGIELEMSDRIEQLINSDMDKESVHGFVTEMWKDEQYKYCAALAACVAKKNAELPSIPEDTSDTALIVGVCQGIDVANVEMRVSAGEMIADKAYKILKTIAAVGLVILVSAGMFIAGVGLAKFAIDVVIKAFGTGVAATILALALGGATIFFVGDDFIGTLKTLKNVFCEISDFTYEKLKKGVKVVHRTVQDHVIPKVKEMIETVSFRLHEVVVHIRQAVLGNRTQVSHT